MQSVNELHRWIARLDPRLYAILIGLTIGIVGGLTGLLLATVGPVVTIGGFIGLIGGLYLITNLHAALYGIIVILMWLPFGTFPFDVGITPTLLDLAIGAFLMVYLFQWMTGRRQRRLNLTPVHALITVYIMWLILAFVLGMRYGSPTSSIIRQFAEVLLSIGLVYVLVDLLNDRATLRKLVLVITLAVAVQALGAVILYLLPDVTAESLLVRLARIGYPDGGVIRYIESTPELGERAIGTWVDPNTLGGLLAVASAIFAPQIFARKPVLPRWLMFSIFAVVALALFLSNSRASFLALSAGLFVIAFVRYRRFIPILLIAGALLLLLPQTQYYIDRLIQAFQGADLATQMRIGEWTDSLRLINRYPIFGVGFTGTPDRDIYTDVANMYLIMANQIGLVGVAIYLIAMSGVFLYGVRAWHITKNDPELDAIHLGYHAGLLTALVNAFADLYFFRTDFQASITWFWLVVALALASSRLTLQQNAQNKPESTVVKYPVIR